MYKYVTLFDREGSLWARWSRDDWATPPLFFEPLLRPPLGQPVMVDAAAFRAFWSASAHIAFDAAHARLTIDDAGAGQRAVLIANRLIAEGRYDWRTQGGIEFFDVYAIDALDVSDLREGVHYTLGRVAPHTDTERVQLQEHKAALEQQQRAAQKAEPDKKLAAVLALASAMGFPHLHPCEVETLATGLERGAVLARDGKITVTLLDYPLTITEGAIRIGAAWYSPEEYARCFGS